ncbi:probable arginine--tRNA ligase, mitochondrial [Watersipora subatra]|uniref:probable arginine--tRNA ligase, mitochondrial n=1 Tax=Watersipora subatra TaxID=2589382 RepID=UPI00355C23B9
MKISTRVTDIHSLRRFVLYEVLQDHCLAEKFAHLCTFQLPPKNKSQASAACLTLQHPQQETEITPLLHSLCTRPSSTWPHSHALKYVSTEMVPKLGTTSKFHLNLDLYKSTILNTVLTTFGGHGIASDIHTWNLETDGKIYKKKSKSLVIDFSSPNIAKPFHAGHLRSTMIGSYISNIRSALGDRVLRLNYLGDWGTQFGLVTAGYRLYGDSAELETNAVQHLYEIYVKINRLLDKDPSLAEEAERACLDLERGEPRIRELWQRVREASVDNYRQLYQCLGVQFDVYEWESEQHVTGKRLMERLKEEGVLIEQDGAYCVDVTDRGKEQKVVLLKSNGSTLYISRDVAAFLSRHDAYKFDKMIYVVEHGQQSHITNIGAIVDKLKLLPHSSQSATELIEHVKFGRVNGMSTRKGTTVLLADILEEAKHKMLLKMKHAQTTKTTGEELERVAEILGISAVIIYDLRLSRMKGYTFSWEEILSFTGMSGPYLQITHARLCSLFENCGVALNPTVSLDNLIEVEAMRLISHLSRYDEVIRISGLQLESHLLVRYLYELCQLSNSALKKLAVKGSEAVTAESRLLLFHCARLTLTDGLKLLGIQPLHSI